MSVELISKNSGNITPHQLSPTAYDDYIKDIYCVVNNGPIEELFNELGFLKEKYKMLFIDESDFDLEGNSHAFIMKRQIRENICC